MDIRPIKGSLLKLLGFYTSEKDLIRKIDNSDTGLPNINDNIASSTLYGMQAIAGQYFDSGLDLNLNYTLTLGTQDVQKQRSGKVGLTNAPEHMIKGNIAYPLNQLMLRFTSRWFDKIGTHKDNTMYAGQSAHRSLIFDTNSYYGGHINNAKWSVDLNIDNLFDKKYYTIPQVDNSESSLPRQPQETRKLYLPLGLPF